MRPAAERALLAGQKAYGARWTPNRAASAPGRLELLGNHVDYNGGPVLAAAIDRRVVVLVEETTDRTDTIEAVFADTDAAELVKLDPSVSVDWQNTSLPPAPDDYLRGTIAALHARPHVGARPGLRLAISGDVPIGFGLSSSAALCAGLTLAVANGPLGDTELVLIAQEAEHRAGTPCGTMDQSASVAGGVILYDGATLETRRLDPVLDGYIFAVADSGVKRSLGASSYPIRVRESHEMLAIARRELGRDMPFLAMLRPDELDTLSQSLTPAIPGSLLRRARHVVSETQRVLDGLAALERGDWPHFGQLMSSSGRSSAVEYEISHPRVEELVAEAREVTGVQGARMMGGGEGGTALILLRRDAVEPLRAKLRAGYYRRHGTVGLEEAVQIFDFAGGAEIRPWDAES